MIVKFKPSATARQIDSVRLNLAVARLAMTSALNAATWNAETRRHGASALLQKSLLEVDTLRRALPPEEGEYRSRAISVLSASLDKEEAASVAFDAFCREHEARNYDETVTRGTYLYGPPAFGSPRGSGVFDHTFMAWRVCLWSPFPELRVGAPDVTEFGIVTEPYGFAGNDAQQAVAKRWGFRFYLLREKGFHNDSTRPFLWVVRDLSKAGGVLQSMLPDWPLRDLHGLVAPETGRRYTLTVVENAESLRLHGLFVDELEAAAADGLRAISPNGAQVADGAAPRCVSTSISPTDAASVGGTP